MSSSPPSRPTSSTAQLGWGASPDLVAALLSQTDGELLELRRRLEALAPVPVAPAPTATTHLDGAGPVAGTEVEDAIDAAPAIAAVLEARRVIAEIRGRLAEIAAGAQAPLEQPPGRPVAQGRWPASAVARPGAPLAPATASAAVPAPATASAHAHAPASTRAPVRAPALASAAPASVALGAHPASASRLVARPPSDAGPVFARTVPATLLPPPPPRPPAPVDEPREYRWERAVKASFERPPAPQTPPQPAPLPQRDLTRTPREYEWEQAVKQQYKPSASPGPISDRIREVLLGHT